MLEKSATMSCPEVAKIALLDPEVMELDEVEEPLYRPSLVKSCFNTSDLRWSNRPQRYFGDLRIFTIDLLQNRTYSLEERLILLGMFYQKLKEHVDAGQVKEIPTLINTYNRVVGDDDIRESLIRILAQSTIQMKFLKELADERFPFVVSAILSVFPNVCMGCSTLNMRGWKKSEKDTRPPMRTSTSHSWRSKGIY